MTSRLEILKRKQRAEGLIPKVRQRLSLALKRGIETIEFLPLEESLDLFRLFERQWEQARNDEGVGRRFFVETSQREEVERSALTVKMAFGGAAMLLFTPQAPYCGAVHVTAAEVLSNLVTLAVLDQDDVLACDATGRTGLACEYFSDRGKDGHQEMYRLIAWQHRLS